MLRISILADKGTDIFEFLYKPKDIDFMWQSPLWITNKNCFSPTSAASDSFFLDCYEGGWQEIFPSDGSNSSYKGAEFGLHGEVYSLPWQASIVEDSLEKVTALRRVLLASWYVRQNGADCLGLLRRQRNKGNYRTRRIKTLSLVKLDLLRNERLVFDG